MSKEFFFIDAYSIFGLFNNTLPKNKEEEAEKIKKYKNFNNTNIKAEISIKEKYDSDSAQIAMGAFCEDFFGSKECIEIILNKKSTNVYYFYIHDAYMLNYNIIIGDIYGTKIQICDDEFKNRFLIEKLNENMYVFVIKYDSKLKIFYITLSIRGIYNIIKQNVKYMIMNRLHEVNKAFKYTESDKQLLIDELTKNKAKIDIQYIAFLNNFLDSVNIFSNDINISNTLVEEMSNKNFNGIVREFNFGGDLFGSIIDFVSIQFDNSSSGILGKKEFLEANAMLFIGARARLSDNISRMSIYDNKTNIFTTTIIPVVKFDSGIEFKFNLTLLSKSIAQMPSSQLIWRPAIKSIVSNFSNEGENYEEN